MEPLEPSSWAQVRGMMEPMEPMKPMELSNLVLALYSLVLELSNLELELHNSVLEPSNLEPAVVHNSAVVVHYSLDHYGSLEPLVLHIHPPQWWSPYTRVSVVHGIHWSVVLTPNRRGVLVVHRWVSLAGDSLVLVLHKSLHRLRRSLEPLEPRSHRCLHHWERKLVLLVRGSWVLMVVVHNWACKVVAWVARKRTHWLTGFPGK